MKGEAKINNCCEEVVSRLVACEFGLLQVKDNHEVRPISFDNARQSSPIYCSVVREINKINERELELGVGSASWHDEYKGGS